jgi:hypothetical protein
MRVAIPWPDPHSRPRPVIHTDEYGAIIPTPRAKKKFLVVAAPADETAMRAALDESKFELLIHSRAKPGQFTVHHPDDAENVKAQLAAWEDVAKALDNESYQP